MDNFRRRVGYYLSKDEIPSSASEPLVGDTFNVAYFPVCRGVPGAENRAIQITATIESNSNSGTKMTLDDFVIVNDSLEAAMHNVKTLRNYDYALGFAYRAYGQYNLLYFCPVHAQSTNNSSTITNWLWSKPKEFMGYIRINLAALFKVTLVDNALGMIPVYIDTE